MNACQHVILLAGFALGMMIQDCLFILQFIVGPNSLWKCYGVPIILATILRILFTVIQTYFVFKNHQVTISRSLIAVTLQCKLGQNIKKNLCLQCAQCIQHVTTT